MARALATLAIGAALGMVAATAAAQGQVARPIEEFPAIAGDWQGEATLRDGNKAAGMWAFREPGRFESRTIRGTNTGTVLVKDGKAHIKYDGTGNTGTLTLHESPDKKPWLYLRAHETGTTWYLWRAAGDGR